MRICFDIEADGLLDTVSVVHCIATRDLDTGEEHLFGPGSIQDALDLLSKASSLHGHNIVGYDLEVLRRLHGWEPNPDVFIDDTNVRSLLTFPDLSKRDAKMRRAQARLGKQPFPANQCGSNTLKAWGLRLGVRKSEFGDEVDDWNTYTAKMGEYCQQDVRVNCALVERLDRDKGRVSRNLQDNEQYVHRILTLQELNGYHVDRDKLDQLVAAMQADAADTADRMQTIFPPREVVYYTPKKKLRRTKEEVFNPRSRKQIAARLTEKYGWEPKVYTDAGSPVVDEKVLSSLPYPEAKELAEAFLLTKRLGQIVDGDNAWYKLMDKDGRLHGRTKVIGTPHGRCSHTKPNMAQIPGVAKKYGKECREAFVPRAGWVQVGCDASGIQLRALAHYLARYDGGDYVKVVTEGDPHTANQQTAGLPTRHDAKTFIYSFLFGAGDCHIGRQLRGEEVSENTARRVGKRTRTLFMNRTKGLAQLVTDLTGVWNSRGGKDGGYLEGVDGRYIPIPSDHVLLNYLLTAFEVGIMKRAIRVLHEGLAAKGWRFGTDYAQLAFVHDEYQFECPKELAEQLGQLARAAITQAGVDLGSRCPLDGEYRIGKNWYECH